MAGAMAGHRAERFEDAAGHGVASSNTRIGQLLGGKPLGRRQDFGAAAPAPARVNLTRDKKYTK